MRCRSCSTTTDEDAELVEDLCEAQFKKGAATNIRSVLSRLVPAKEPTSKPEEQDETEHVLYSPTGLEWISLTGIAYRSGHPVVTRDEVWSIVRKLRAEIVAALAKERTSLHDACQVLENARKQAGKEHL
jgi:hypothetical protein